MSATLEQVMYQWANSDSYIEYGTFEHCHLIQLILPSSLINKRDEEKINWINKQISNWSSCKQIHFNSWEFESKNDAEKLLSMYYLKWNS
jgi:hypothetical protein